MSVVWEPDGKIEAVSDAVALLGGAAAISDQFLEE